MRELIRGADDERFERVARAEPARAIVTERRWLVRIVWNGFRLIGRAGGHCAFR
jgi:hypothetical protein